MKNLLFLIIILVVSLNTYSQKTKSIWLDDLKIKSFSEGIPAVLGKTNAGGDSIRMNGKLYKHGVGVSSTSVLSFFLDGHATEFSAIVGVDDKGVKDLPLKFYVIGDRKILFESGEMKLGDEPKPVKVNLTGVKRLGLLVTIEENGFNRSYSNWANAQFVMKDDFIPQNTPNSDEKYILTPKPEKKPKINSPKLFGARPNNPFLYTIATTGERPMIFSVKGLPEGLSVDSKTGLIIGKITQKGT
ncbi:MAG: NPCBM/NEW2 domain-containing protein, partial [Emticicia sp.]